MKVASVANSKRHINLIPWGAETPQGTNVGLIIAVLSQPPLILVESSLKPLHLMI